MNAAWARLGKAERARRQASEAERGRYEVRTLSTLGLGGGPGEGLHDFWLRLFRGTAISMTAFRLGIPVDDRQICALMWSYT